MKHLGARSEGGGARASTAAQASVRYGFEQLTLDYIMAITAPTNYASQQVMQKIGLKYAKNVDFYGIKCAYYFIYRHDWQAQ